MPSMPVLGAVVSGGFALVTAAVVIGTGALSSGTPVSESSNRTVHGLVPLGPTVPKTTNLTQSAGRELNTQTTAASAIATSTTGGNTLDSSAGNGVSSTSATTTPQRDGSFSGAAGLPSTQQSTASSTYSNSTAATPAPGTAKHAIQSAQLQLTTPNGHIEQVASEVYDVVGLENGTVQNSHVTQANGSGNQSYAEFSLTIPTSNLQETMTRLSQLHYATVSSRTDGVQNVSSQYSSDQHNIADEKATRVALLKELQSAYTTTAIDSIKAQLQLAERQLASDENALGSLQHKISYSSLNVQVNAGPIIFPLRHSSSSNKSFTIGKATHDAGRVLVVMAGIMLIGLAVLLPIALVIALLAWVGFLIRHRRREHALDVS
jgi:hypothetical protein